MTHLEEYKCVVTLIHRKLHFCRLMPDGTPRSFGSRLDWKLVEAPISQEFLDAVNGVLGTRFCEADFKRDKKTNRPKRMKLRRL